MKDWLKTQIPTAVILLVIALVAAIYFGLGQYAAPVGVPELTPFRMIILIIVGFLAGVLGGIIGTGGCSVMLPVLHFWMGYPAPIAVGTTLFAVIFTAISGGYGHLVRGNLDKRAVAWLGGAGIIGVVIGSWLFTFLSSQSALLGLILGILFLWPALRMIWEGIRHSGLPQKEGNKINASATGLGVFGLVVGLATGVAGLGGGYALVPGLIYLFGAPVYITMGTSLATMIPLAVIGGGLKLAGGFVDLAVGLLLAAGTVIGAQVGAAVIKRFKPNTLKLIFGVYFLYVSVKFITAFFGVKVW
ncbi:MULTISPECIES: sulfite exporter TauE/SafE family protein [Anaerolinea]|uniref:sulfite exporter TauE/SafE family protein n=1 Tax=Anaerolinea TaxID=233189 RepID=UPI002619EB02|nr:sulfite exporter TauE/SafE family protein [Anaerolinea thermophila]